MARTTAAPSSTGQKWTQDEHERFLDAMALYPQGSWKQRAKHVRTRSARQVMTHAHKIQEKRERHERGLFKAGRPPRGSAPKPASTHASKPTSRRHKREIPSTREGQERTSTSPPPMEPIGGIVAMLQPEAPIHGLQLAPLFPSDAWCARDGPFSPVSPGAGAFTFDSGEVSEFLDLMRDVEEAMSPEAIV